MLILSFNSLINSVEVMFVCRHAILYLQVTSLSVQKNHTLAFFKSGM